VIADREHAIADRERAIADREHAIADHATPDRELEPTQVRVELGQQKEELKWLEAEKY
jgi:hypothetical protein